MVAVKPTMPKAEIAAITPQSDRWTFAKRSVANHTNGASTMLAIAILRHEAVKIEKCSPTILLSGVAVPNSAIPHSSWAMVAGEEDVFWLAMVDRESTIEARQSSGPVASAMPLRLTRQPIFRSRSA